MACLPGHCRGGTKKTGACTAAKQSPAETHIVAVRPSQQRLPHTNPCMHDPAANLSTVLHTWRLGALLLSLPVAVAVWFQLQRTCRCMELSWGVTLLCFQHDLEVHYQHQTRPFERDIHSSKPRSHSLGNNPTSRATRCTSLHTAALHPR